METRDWQDPELRLVCAEMRTAHDTPPYAATETAIFAAFNAAAEPAEVTLPEPTTGTAWSCAIDSAVPEAPPCPVAARTVEVAGQSVAVFVMEPA
jgi:glycogen operon protein